MSGRHKPHDAPDPKQAATESASPLRSLIERTEGSVSALAPINGVAIGELVAIRDGGRTPLIVYPGRPGAEAFPARTTVDLHGAHIGKQVVIMCESGYSGRPIVIGVLRDGESWPLDQRPGTVEVDTDGERMIISAKRQLVLRCGKASIALDRDGKITIRGTHVVSHADGVNRVRGGSVQLN